MKRCRGVLSTEMVSAVCLLVLMSANSLFAQPNNVTLRLEQIRGATRTMVKGLNDRWFEYWLRYELPETSASKGTVKTAAGVFSLRQNGRYAFFEYDVKTDEAAYRDQQHELFHRDGVVLWSGIFSGHLHSIEYRPEGSQTGNAAIGLQDYYDVMRLFDRSIGRYVFDEFARPKIDRDGRFTLEFSPSMRKRNAQSNTAPEVHFKLFFDPQSHLPIKSVGTLADDKGDIKTRVIQIAYSGDRGRWHIARWLEKASEGLSSVTRREYRIREARKPEWLGEPFRMFTPEDPAQFMDPKIQTKLTADEFARLPEYVVKVERQQFRDLQKRRTATIQKIEDDPPSAVNFPSAVPILLPETNPSSSPLVFWSIGAVTVCSLAVVAFWFVAWRKLQVKRIGHASHSERQDAS